MKLAIDLENKTEKKEETEERIKKDEDKRIGDLPK